MTPALAAAYAVRPWPRIAATEETQMIAPPPRWIMGTAAAWVASSMDLRSTAITRSHSSSEVSRRSLRDSIPTLLWRMSRAPYRSMAALTIRRQSSPWVTSPAHAAAMPLGGRGLHGRLARPSGARLDGVGIDAEEPQLSAQPAPLSADEPRMPRMLVVGVIGVQHQLGAAHLDGGEVRVDVVDDAAEHIPVEGHGARHLPHDEVGHEGRQHPPVTVRRDPRLCRAPLHAFRP